MIGTNQSSPIVEAKIKINKFVLRITAQEFRWNGSTWYSRRKQKYEFRSHTIMKICLSVKSLIQNKNNSICKWGNLLEANYEWINLFPSKQLKISDEVAWNLWHVRIWLPNLKTRLIGISMKLSTLTSYFC